MQLPNRYFLLVLSCLALTSKLSAQTIQHDSRVLKTGLNSPWELRWGMDGWIWFTERNGRISRLNPETLEQKVLLRDLEVFQWHEGGMLGFDFHPAFPDSPFIFVAHTYYNHGQKANELRIYRYTYADDTLTSKELIYGDIFTNALHAGGRLLIHDGLIYLTSGDLGRQDSAQLVNSTAGKVLRFKLDGSIPSDNPYFPSPVWSYGHRNPQGLVIGRGRFYSAEHGNNCDDEVNLLSKGLNYGWPLIEGYCDNVSEERACDSTSLIEPLFSWTPTLGISGIDFYDHDAIPEWKNSILIAALKDKSINQLKLDSAGQRIIQARRYSPLAADGEPIGRYRDFCISPSGRLFASTSAWYKSDDTSDMIVEFTRTGVVPSEVSLSEPPNEFKTTADSVIFKWRSVAGDAAYEIELSTSPDFDHARTILDAKTADTLYRYGLGTSDQPLYWRVREVTSAGPWSETRTFTSMTGAVPLVASEPECPQMSIVESKLTCLIPPALGTARLSVSDILGHILYDADLFPGRFEIPINSITLASGTLLFRIHSNTCVNTQAIHLGR